MDFNIISVIGLGYIGLPTAAMFASKRKNVIGVDVSQHVVDTINAGEIHIVEPELDVMVNKAVDEGFLKATTAPEQADVFLIAVPTPFLPVETQYSIPKPDLSYIKAAAKSVAKVLKRGDVVILESTSPVGATEEMAIWLAEEREDLTFPQTHGSQSDIRVAYCPERVLPGNVIRELIKNDRVIGGMTESCSKAAIEVYSVFVEGDCIATNTRTAEMTKLTENASRDVSIALANELSIICDEHDIDVWELIRLANRHPRVNILQPGPGVGGHCIAVDPWFIVAKSPEKSSLITCARRVNDHKPIYVLNKIEEQVAYFLDRNPQKSINDVKISCFGLSFKPDIDDLRESPALKIALELARRYPGQITAAEPNLKNLEYDLGGNLRLASYSECYDTGDIKVLLVGHSEFKKHLKPPHSFVDCVGLWSE